LKIRQGVLESLSGEMVFYTLPGDVTAQPPQGGIVLIAKLKDAKLWEQSLSAVEKFASQNKNINNMLQTGTQVINGKTCHVWSVMPLAVAGITPTWITTNDTFVLTSNPQLCIQAVSQVESGTNSLGNTEGFKKYASNLPENLLTLRYADSKTQFNQAMMGMQQSWPTITMAVANSGIKLPLTLPSVTNITEKMEPSFQYRWFDDKGFHSYYRGPGIEPSLTTIAAGSLGLGILMPALARTKQTAEQIDTLKNLSAIGKAMLIYADRNEDYFPPTLQDFSKVGGLDPKVFESKRKPADFVGPTYIYITGQTTSYDPGNILVYENPAYCSDGVNVLYLDSHVKFLKKEDFLKELKATYQRVRKPMPEIKFKD
jgi:prepilin-type processing-associated H-X9-DG protein